MATGRARIQPALQSICREAPESSGAARSGWIPDWRQLARRGQRQPDAGNAGGAEHRPGIPRPQSQMQFLPRQFHQPVEIERRVRARELLLRAAAAAAVSVRRRPESVRGAPVSVSRAEPRSTVRFAGGSPIGGRRDLHRSAERPPAANSCQPHLASSVRPRDRRQPGRDGRRAVESCAARLAGGRLRRSRLRPEASAGDAGIVARVPDARGAAQRRTTEALRVPGTGGPAHHRRTVRRCDCQHHR